MRVSTDRVLIGAVLAVSLVTLGLQAFVLRPRLWPVPGEDLRHFLRRESRLDSAYMAPEQLRGEAVDARADVFSLGVMAYGC